MATVLCFQPSDHMHLIPYIAAIHASCITHDRAVATFLPPLTHDKLLKWWKDRVSEVKDGTRILYVLVKSPQAGARILGTEVAGVVMLEMPRSETGSFRGAVEKLLVHPTYRNRGGARALVEELERDASRCGRTMLVRGPD
jgi:ribosomal protein S18 acetylase RimI-like enzyme